MSPEAKLVAIPYTIHAYSSYSSTYAPAHILTNTPSTAKSRWSASSGSSVQSLTLSIPPPYVLKMIIFGKYRERHVCNIKEYTIEIRSDDASDDDTGWVEALNGGLRNDTIAEWVEINGWWSRAAQPVRYLRITPRTAHGVNYNYSIWYVELRGYCDPELYSRCFSDARLLRQRRLSTTLAIAAEIGGWEFPREDSGICGNKRKVEGEQNTNVSKISERLLLCRLFTRYLIHGNYENARNILKQVKETNLLTEPFRNTNPSLYFEHVKKNEIDLWPPGLGGHQMCADKKRNRLWMFGGYDGTNDTNSLWFFDCETEKWSEVQHKLASEWNGPEPNSHLWPPCCSCHRMVYAPLSDVLVVFGAFFSQSREELPSVWLYHIEDNEWEEIKGSRPWPIARYDHQMIILTGNDNKEAVYILGGTTHGVEDGGLWKFDLNTQKFTQISSKNVTINVADSDCATASALPSGYGMIHGALVPFAGPECLAVSSHLLSYQMKETAILNVETGTRRPILGNSAVSPPIAATLRCVLLPSKNILAFSGLQYTLRPTNQLWDTESCSVWHFNTHKFKWKRLCVINSTGLGTPGKPRFELPDSRELGGGQNFFRGCPSETLFGSSTISALAPSREHLKALIQRSALEEERRKLSIPSDLNDFGDVPLPRYAHQLCMVNDSTAYLYGGNPSTPGEISNRRLNDLWKIKIALPHPSSVANCFEYLLTRVEALNKATEMLNETNDKRAEVIEYYLNLLKQQAAIIGYDVWGDDLTNVVRAMMGIPDMFAREIVASEMANSGNIIESMKCQLAILFCETMGIASGEDLWDYM